MQKRSKAETTTIIRFPLSDLSDHVAMITYASAPVVPNVDCAIEGAPEADKQGVWIVGLGILLCALCFVPREQWLRLDGAREERQRVQTSFFLR